MMNQQLLAQYCGKTVDCCRRVLEACWIRDAVNVDQQCVVVEKWSYCQDRSFRRFSVSQMDFQVGIRGDGFTMLCCDTRAVTSIITIKNDEDKLVPIDKHRMFAVSGEAGDRVYFSEYIVANVKLYALRNGHSLTTHAIANLTRQELAKALRRGPFATNLLLGGFDEGAGSSLYWLDYLGAMHKMNICGHGYGSNFVLSLFDKMWRPDLTKEDALEMMRKGVAEVRKRLMVTPQSFQVKVVTADGIEDLGML